MSGTALDVPPDLSAIIDDMPGWRDAANVAVEPIEGGITNRNFRVVVDHDAYFVRIAGQGSEHLGIDRDVEHAVASTAAQLGIGPPVVAYLPERHCLVTRFLDGTPVPSEQLRQPETLARFVQSLSRLHHGPPIPGTFSPFRVVVDYRVAAERRGVDIPALYWLLLDEARAIEEAFSIAPPDDRPCHNDLLNSNFLSLGDRIAVVDYEYAGMGDAFFDLGNLSVNNGFDDRADVTLLELYFGEVTPARYARLKLMRIMSDFREAMWGVLQQGLSTLDFDYVDYANQHLERCRRQAESPDCATWRRDAAGAV